MMDRQHGEIVWECDNNCGEVLETGTGDFSTALTTLKESGWLIKKVGSGYEHFCEDCRHDEE